MTNDLENFSKDQISAYDAIAETLKFAGVDLTQELLSPKATKNSFVLGVIGRAGTGKTLLISKLFHALELLGVNIITGDYESRKVREERSLAILAPTNKAASVLRNKGVPATTLHRILYTPIYDPEYENIAEWLLGNTERPDNDSFEKSILDRIIEFYKVNKSIPRCFGLCGLKRF